jgi:hypothetical protein
MGTSHSVAVLLLSTTAGGSDVFTVFQQLLNLRGDLRVADALSGSVLSSLFVRRHQVRVFFRTTMKRRTSLNVVYADVV